MKEYLVIDTTIEENQLSDLLKEIFKDKANNFQMVALKKTGEHEIDFKPKEFKK